MVRYTSLFILTVFITHGSWALLPANSSPGNASASTLTSNPTNGPMTLEIKSTINTQGAKKLSLDLFVSGELDKAILKELSSVVLGDAPKEDEQRVFASQALASAIRAKLGSEKYNFRIPNQVIAKNEGLQINSKEVESQLLSHWKSQCADCKFKIKNLSVPKLAKEHRGLPWQLDLPSAFPRGSFNHRIRIQSDSGAFAQYWLSGELSILREVPVLKRSVNMGDRLSEEDFKMELREVTFSSDTPPSPSQVVGSRMRFISNANEIIWNRSIERERAVRRGDIVKAYIGEGDWQIVIQARTEQDGHIGDRINVRNLQTNHLISGEVVRPGEVMVK